MSLINTRIQNIRAKGNFGKNELRPSQYGALDMFMQQSDEVGGILTPELRAAAEKSIGSTLQTPVFDFDSGITIGNTRSVTIADSENTSQLVTITFATYSWGFTSAPAMFMNNEISMQSDFEQKFNKYLYKFGAVLDTAALTLLAAQKTQVFTDQLDYTVTGNVIQTPWSKREKIIGDINPMLAANDHFGDIHLLGNAGVNSVIRNLAQSGLYNAENKQMQYDDKILHFSSRLTNGAGEYGNMYAVQGGSLGILTRFEREALLNTVSRDGHEWGIDTLPLLNFPIGTYYYDSVGDFNAINGAASADLTRARKEHFGFAVDVAFVSVYNSSIATIANPIMKATILDATAADTLNVKVVNTVDEPVFTDEIPAGV
ncbi:MAG: hypothetical protein HQ522_07865 [Bacteroidetes bacterium]|nr:hypothetical protein [Bacteroidota bacterium]